MSDKDVQNFIDGAVDFLSMIFSGLMAALDVIPPIVLGFICFGLLLIWAKNKVS